MVKWVQEVICDHYATTMEPIDEDLFHLSIPPSFRALEYKKMKAYNNQFFVDDESSNLCVTFDYSVASTFEQVEGNGDDVLGPIQYVGLLKQILQLDYGCMSSPIILFQCEWVRNGIDNRGNPTYKWDDVGFLLVNFWHLLHEHNEPFVFPSQVQQVFFWSEPWTPTWKVVLHRELRNQRVVVDSYDDCLKTCGVAFELKAPMDFHELDSSRAMIGAIELNREETILASQALRRNVRVDDSL